MDIQGFNGTIEIINSIFVFNGLDSTTDALGAPVTVNFTSGAQYHVREYSEIRAAVTVSDTIFDQNKGRAGALHVIRASQLDLRNLTCSNNIGGALLAEEVPYVMLDSSHFTGNHAGDRSSHSSAAGGGALLFLDCSRVQISDSIFRNCSSLRSGGAVYMDFGFQAVAIASTRAYMAQGLNLISTSFYNCTSYLQNGGAVFSQNSYVFGMDRMTYSNCSAAISGGAVYAAASKILEVSASSFVNCTAGVLLDGWLFSRDAGIAVDTSMLQSGGGGLYATTTQQVSASFFDYLRRASGKHNIFYIYVIPRHVQFQVA